MIAACYIFKFHQCKNYGTTYGVFIRLRGFAPRYRLQQVCIEMINVLSEKTGYDIQVLIPKIETHSSIQTYLRSIYCVEENLLYNCADVKDAVSLIKPTQIFQITHEGL